MFFEPSDMSGISFDEKAVLHLHHDWNIFFEESCKVVIAHPLDPDEESILNLLLLSLIGKNAVRIVLLFRMDDLHSAQPYDTKNEQDRITSHHFSPASIIARHTTPFLMMT
jgi:hypothetical protein